MSAADRDIAERADEFVLGLLDGSEAAAVERDMAGDPVLRAAVAASRDRFLALDLTVEPVAVDEGLWPRIDARLEGVRTGAGDGRSDERLRPANDNTARWRLGALAGLAATVLLAIGLAWSLVTAPEPRVIAVLLDATGEPRAIVEDFGDSSARVVLLSEFEVPADRTMQVWTLPSTEMGPVSLGLLADGQSAVLHGPTLPAPRDDQLYEITLEQAGGSPTGRPTGPILVKGFARLPRN